MRRFLVSAVAAASLLPGTLAGAPIPPAPSYEPDSDPAWSPDGRNVTFRRVGAVLTVGRDGKRLRTLARRAVITWLPNGRLGLDGIDGVYVINANGSGRRFITDGDLPAWSPSGRFVVVRRYDADRNTTRLVIVDVRTRGESPVPGPSCRCPFTDDDASWSPRENRFVFSRFVDDPDAGQGHALFIVSRDGTGARQLYGSLVRRPVWSPSGHLIAAAARPTRTAGPHVMLIDPEGGVARNLHPGSSPAWSPDGSWIAFEQSGGGAYVIRPDGSGLRQLPGGTATCVSTASPCTTPAWSPDGRRVLFQRGLTLVVADSRGPNAHLIRGAIRPSWSPDSRWIAYATPTCGARQGIYIASASGAGRRRLTRHCSVSGSELAERLIGTPADDSIEARDGNRDLVVCRAGFDRVAADRRDRVAADCERVSRRAR